MNSNRHFSVLLLLILLSAFYCGKKENALDNKGSDDNELKEVDDNSTKKKMTFNDYLGSGISLTFDNVEYKLTWSSHPSENLYMQEYLSENDSIENFKKLVLLQAVTGNAKIKEVVDLKVSELKKMKETDPMVNYDLFEKNGEIMLDFIVFKNLPESNEPEFIERNVYRYKTLMNEGKVDGVILFGVSERAYGNNINKYLTDLKAHRFDVPNEVGAFSIPEIKIIK